MSLLLTLSIIVGSAGFVILTAGWIGRRVHEHPTCRRCKYDLSGIWPTEGEARCPECGSNLNTTNNTIGTRRGAVQRGYRAKRRVFVWVGLLSLLAGTGGSGMILWPTLKAMRWDEFKPDWWLVSETDSTDADLADRALRLLRARLERESLSDGNINKLVARGLALQADQSQIWLPAWGNLIEQAWFDDRLTNEQKLSYAENAVSWTLHVSQTRVKGEFWVFAIKIDSKRCGDTGSIFGAPVPYGPVLFGTSVKSERILIDGVDSSLSWSFPNLSISMTHSTWSPVSKETMPLDLGEHTVAIELVATFDAVWAPGKYDWPGLTEDDSRALVLTIPLAGQYRVVERAESPNQNEDDPDGG